MQRNETNINRVRPERGKREAESRGPHLAVDGEHEGVGGLPQHGERVLDTLVRDLHREPVHAVQPDQAGLLAKRRVDRHVRVMHTRKVGGVYKKGWRKGSLKTKKRVDNKKMNEQGTKAPCRRHAAHGP